MKRDKFIFKDIFLLYMPGHLHGPLMFESSFSHLYQWCHSIKEHEWASMEKSVKRIVVWTGSLVTAAERCFTMFNSSPANLYHWAPVVFDSPMQFIWPWPPVRIFMTWHKVVRFVWEFDCLHFAQYISIRPHGIDCKQTWCIDCKQTWCKTIYHINRATW